MFRNRREILYFSKCDSVELKVLGAKRSNVVYFEISSKSFLRFFCYFFSWRCAYSDNTRSYLKWTIKLHHVKLLKQLKLSTTEKKIVYVKKKSKKRKKELRIHSIWSKCSFRVGNFTSGWNDSHECNWTNKLKSYFEVIRIENNSFQNQLNQSTLGSHLKMKSCNCPFILLDVWKSVLFNEFFIASSFVVRTRDSHTYIWSGNVETSRQKRSIVEIFAQTMLANHFAVT